MKKNIAIIGAGSITHSYIKILKLKKNTKVISISSRTFSKAKKISKLYNIKSVYKDYHLMIKNEKIDAIFILVSADQIFKVTKDIIHYQIPILIEKPPGLNMKESKGLARLSRKYGTKNMVGLNRRFYSNFKKGLNILKKYGGIENIVIEGHERFWRIKNKINQNLEKNWIFANGIHTIDLLRFFGGEIDNIKTIKSSVKEKNGDQFLSLIKFKKNISGVYISNWYAPGGWSVKLFGNGITVIFNPLENGYYLKSNMKRYDIKVDKVDIDFKAGLYKQITVFIDYISSGKLRPPAQTLLDTEKTMSLISKIKTHSFN